MQWSESSHANISFHRLEAQETLRKVTLQTHEARHTSVEVATLLTEPDAATAFSVGRTEPESKMLSATQHPRICAPSFINACGTGTITPSTPSCLLFVLSALSDDLDKTTALSLEELREFSRGVTLPRSLLLPACGRSFEAGAKLPMYASAHKEPSSRRAIDGCILMVGSLVCTRASC